jgi:hypothetical protein
LQRIADKLRFSITATLPTWQQFRAQITLASAFALIASSPDVTGAYRPSAGTLRRGVLMREQLNSVALFPREQRHAGCKR